MKHLYFAVNGLRQKMPAGFILVLRSENTPLILACYAGSANDFGLLLFPAAFLVGLSRIYLGLHYPTDVAIGAVIGMSAALLFQIWI